MEHLSQKVIYLGNLRNGQYFRPLYDCEVSPLFSYKRLYSKGHTVTVWDPGTGSIILLPVVLLVRRVIETE